MTMVANIIAAVERVDWREKYPHLSLEDIASLKSHTINFRIGEYINDFWRQRDAFREIARILGSVVKGEAQ